MRRKRRSPGARPPVDPSVLGNWGTDPLRALIEQAKDAQRKVAGAKGLVTLGGQEAAHARRAADQSLYGIDRWKPVSSGFRGISEALGLSEAAMGTALARATHAEEHSDAARRTLDSLEGLLNSLHDGLSHLADSQPC